MSSPTPEPVASSPSPVPSALAADSPYAQAVSFPFAEITAAFEKPSVPEQRSLVAAALALKDGTGVCKEAILIDTLYKALKFSHTAGLNRTQTRIFYDIYRSLLEHIKTEPAPSRDQSFEAFKRQLVSYTRDPSVSSPSPQPIPQSASVAADLKVATVAPDSWDPDADAIKIEEERKKAAEEKARQEQEEKEKDPKKAKAKAPPPKKDDKKKDKSKGDADAQSAAASVAASPEPRPPPLVFTVAIAKEIADYVADTVFAHYLLFQAVFHPTFFSPFKVVQRDEVYLQTPLWQLEQYPLEAAEKYEEQLRADEEARVKKEQEEKEKAQKAEEEARAAAAAAEKAAAEEAERLAKDPVASLVNQHLARIQQQLDEKLKTHAEELEQKIAALERRGG